MNIASAVILCTIVGAVGAIILVAAAKFMAVEEDEKQAILLCKTSNAMMQNIVCSTPLHCLLPFHAKSMPLAQRISSRTRRHHCDQGRSRYFTSTAT